MKTATLDVRRAHDRGRMLTSWLDARFSFSFGDWRDPARMSFGSLRALNEDVIQPGTGFAMHPHKDLDIFMLPLSGTIEHRDSLGNHSQVRADQVLRMQAGSGIRHSQMNASRQELDHHLQIWFTPRLKGKVPSVETRDFDLFGSAGRWCRIASPDDQGGGFRTDHGASLSSTLVLPGVPARYDAPEGAALYLHVIDGMVAHDGITLQGGDALAITGWPGHALRIEARGPSSRLLMFEFGPDAG